MLQQTCLPHPKKENHDGHGYKEHQAVSLWCGKTSSESLTFTAPSCIGLSASLEIFVLRPPILYYQHYWNRQEGRRNQGWDTEERRTGKGKKSGSLRCMHRGQGDGWLASYSPAVNRISDTTHKPNTSDHLTTCKSRDVSMSGCFLVLQEQG